MPSIKKISAPVATLICINSMIGAGLFISPKPLTELAGPLGFMGYVFSSLIFLPIILSIAKLAQHHPVAGGLYVYAKNYMGKFAGFVSGWAYFVGKTTTVALLAHTIVQFFQSVSPWFASFSTLTIDFLLIFSFIIINILGVQVGGKIQYLFTALKSIPILFTFGVGFITFNPSFYTINQKHVLGSLESISTAAFALLSFEIICSIGHLIENPEKNIRRAIIAAFLIVTGIDIIFPLILFGTLGPSLAQIPMPVLALGLKVMPTIPWLANLINGIVYAAITAGFFSILTSNCWNLHTLAVNGHLPFAGYLTRLSKTNVPWISLIVEGVLGCIIISKSDNQIALINMSVFAQTIALLLSVIAAYLAAIAQPKNKLSKIIPLLGIVSCGFIIILSYNRILQSGVSFAFLAIFLAGGIAALLKKIYSKPF